MDGHPDAPGGGSPHTATAGPGVAVRCRDVVLAHGDRVVLHIDHLEVPTGVVVAVIGPNGAGKSSFLRAVAGLLTPVSGTLEVPVRRRRGDVAFVLQSTAVDPHLPLTVVEAVRMGRYARRGWVRPMGATDHLAVRSALERMAVTELARRRIHELSGGQRQRVLVAQGLAQEAPLVLLDEPATGIDLTSRACIVEAMAAERDAGRTVLVATHDLSDARQADLVILLARRLVAFGPPGEVLAPEPMTTAFGGQILEVDGVLTVLGDRHRAPQGAAVGPLRLGRVTAEPHVHGHPGPGEDAG